jgi:hypothetical protein
MIQDATANQLGDSGNFFYRLASPENWNSTEAADDFVALSEKGYVVVITDRRTSRPDISRPANLGQVLCMAPKLVRDDESNDEDDDNGASSLASSVVGRTLLMAVLASMLFAYT